MLLPTGTWIVLADSGRYLVMENTGSASELRLKLLRSEEQDLPLESEDGSGRPGRMSQPSTPKSAFEETDWRRLAKAEWAKELADQLNNWASTGKFDKLLLAAAPRTLGDLRPHMSGALKAKLVAELDKDLTKHHVKDIETLISNA